MTFTPSKIASARAVILGTKQSLEKILGVGCEIEVRHFDANEDFAERILKLVELETCVSVKEIKSGTCHGDRKVKRAKILSVALVKKHCADFVLKQIADLTGYDSAVQTSAALRKHADLMMDDDQYRGAYKKIKNTLELLPQTKYILEYQH